MPSHSAAARPGPRALLIVAAAVVVLVLAAVVGWWAMTARAADSSADPVGTPAGSGTLPADTAMGQVELDVRDLPATLAYYRDAVGLEVLDESDTHAVLGFDSPLLRLDLRADLDRDDPRSAGLYHSAILFSDEASLAAALASIARTAPESYQGAADHAVSLAFYFGDPEGNGLELYVDRPRSEWVWQDGRVRMGSAPLDPNAFMAEHLGATVASAATMGHVHLRVGDLDQARSFYEGVLGFDVTAEVDGALFYSAGGYHHHLATNTWQSAGAGVRADAAGLGAFTVVLPDGASLAAMADRLAAAAVEVEASGEGLLVEDPWGNRVHVIVG